MVQGVSGDRSRDKSNDDPTNANVSNLQNSELSREYHVESEASVASRGNVER